MQIHVAHNGQRLGPFSAEEIRTKLYSGEIKDSDLAWSEGAPDWAPLSTFLTPPLPDASISAPPPLRPAALAPPAAPTSSLGIASLICGIASWTALPLVAAVPAIICGHLSLREIRASAGRIGGRGMAVAGLITGYMNVAIVALVILLFVGFFAVAISSMKEYNLVPTPAVPAIEEPGDAQAEAHASTPAVEL